MSSSERLAWLSRTWGRLQDDAWALLKDIPEQAPTARCYESLAMKTQFDDDRELEFALQRQRAFS